MVRTSRSAWRVAATHSVAAALVAALSAVGASVANAQPAAKTATPTAAASPSQRAPARVTNSLGMHFVRIPAGEFTMGSGESMARLTRAFPGFEPDELQPLVDEAPAHRVRITRSYCLGQHEVTVGQFRRFLQASGYVPESIADGTGGYGYNAAYDPRTSASGDNFDGRDPRYTWANPGFAQGDDHPVDRPS